MSSTAPIRFVWTDDGVMKPASEFWARRADKEYVVGEEYELERHERRSMKSHNRFFACVHTAWENLPEDKKDQYPSPDHLRRWALIRAGYYNERIIDCADEEAAQRFAAFCKPLDEFAVVIARGNQVKVYTAKSQDHRSMNKEEFKKSADDVIAVLERVIGVEPGQLSEHAGKAA